MIYVTNNYHVESFEDEMQVLNYIQKDLVQHGLSVQLVFDKTEKDIRVMVYQYETLYLEIYVITKKINLLK